MTIMKAQDVHDARSSEPMKFKELCEYMVGSSPDGYLVAGTQHDGQIYVNLTQVWESGDGASGYQINLTREEAAVLIAQLARALYEVDREKN